MKAITQKLSAILAQAKGTRWDVVAARGVGILGAVAGLAPYAHLIPGKTGALIAGGSAVAAALLPRATKAAGLLNTAYGQQTPLLKVLPALLSTLFSGPQIVAQAKAEAKVAEAQQIADQQGMDRAKLINDAISELESRMKTGAYPPGLLSQDVPAALQVFQSLESKPASEAQIIAEAPVIAGQPLEDKPEVAVEDKSAPVEGGTH